MQLRKFLLVMVAVGCLAMAGCASFNSDTEASAEQQTREGDTDSWNDEHEEVLTEDTITEDKLTETILPENVITETISTEDVLTEDIISARENKFATAGELIEKASNYGWLLPKVPNGYIPVKAELSADTVWSSDAKYDIVLTLPDDIFGEKFNCNGCIYYTPEPRVNDIATIAFLLCADNGYAYCGYNIFVAEDDLQIPGESKADVKIIGDNQLQVTLGTVASTERGDDSGDGYIRLYPENPAGLIVVNFRELPKGDVPAGVAEISFGEVD